MYLIAGSSEPRGDQLCVVADAAGLRRVLGSDEMPDQSIKGGRQKQTDTLSSKQTYFRKTEPFSILFCSLPCSSVVRNVPEKPGRAHLTDRAVP